MEKKGNYIDLNYEEISPDRTLADAQFANGLQNFRFSVAPSGGGCVIPNMSYFLIEYSFGSAGSTAYTATTALKQSQKIALQNNWPACLYNAARFTAAQSEISVINSSHAQAHTLKQRMGRNTEFIESLGYDLNAFDPDFSRRLARSCSDGVYHRDGLIDCSPYKSNALSPLLSSLVPLYTQAETVLPLVTSGLYYAGSVFSTPTVNAAVAYGYMSRTVVFSITGGNEIKIGDPNLGTDLVASFQWQFPDFSELPGTPAQNISVIDGTLINKEDIIKFYVGTSAEAVYFNALQFRVADKKAIGSRTALDLVPLDQFSNDTKIRPDYLITIFGANPVLAVSGVVSVDRGSFRNPYTQADPRSNVVNGMVAYQPPVSFFDIPDPGVFFGDMEIQLTPNSNWAQACVESAVPGTYYDTDVKHGTDYSFGIKSMRLYLARARLMVAPERSLSFSVDDIQISNKQLTSGASTINFNIPPSTQKIICWIQDSAVGSNSKLPLTRFKTRQYTGTGNLTALNKYGPWAQTYDERLQSIQLNFAGITKPQTLFQRGNTGTVANITNSMLQRWIMNNQMNDDKQSPEKYMDWLSMGPYYVFDFTRSADNQGTYLTVSVNYDSPALTDGSAAGSTQASNINLYIATIYTRDIAITYGEYGNIVSVQTQQR